ncbi:MAG: DUF1638 domain-containing protein [Methanomassiliicoccaceae archaeon]|jgi:hypothetical protein|nr:DUF1638 domain-containing protein [Methanomassiliicoccaceae archaeon]
MAADGVLGVMACPILEDELIYSISRDPDVSNVYVLNNRHAKSIKIKLLRNNIEHEIIDEEQYLNGSLKIKEDGYTIVIWMMDLGLHEEPADLRDAVHRCMMRMEERIDAIALYYGLCGNGLKDVDIWAKENLSIPMTIIRDNEGNIVDDCISAAIGGTKQYLRLLRKYPGIMYFTPAFATNYDDLLGRMELFKGVDTGDESMLKMVFEMADYHEVMKIDTGLGDPDEFQAATEKFADRLGFSIFTLEDGWVTLEPAERVYAEAKGFLERP